ncbi:MAG: CheY-like receiver [Caulobacter sp.]|jgi:CheY-like chemotaxis protein|nr:CheY-like receiver [Caulobacter sp.]
MSEASRLPILFVDDEVLIAMVMSDALEGAGYDVECAANAGEAEAAMGKRRFAALITDIDLGGGPDGFELARYARKGLADLPVIYISGRCAQRYDTEKVSGSRFIAKPFVAGDLIRTLPEVIGAH